MVHVDMVFNELPDIKLLIEHIVKEHQSFEATRKTTASSAIAGHYPDSRNVLICLHKLR